MKNIAPVNVCQEECKKKLGGHDFGLKMGVVFYGGN
jgi:hypothetical protein